MKTYEIALIKGDGIGPEVIDEAVKVLNAVAKKFAFQIEYLEYLMGGIAYELTGNPLPQETIDGVKASDACLFGAIGGEKWDILEDITLRPEAGLLKIRKELNLFTNLRPAIVYDEFVDASNLKPEIIKGVNIMFVRELTGGIYFGEKKTGITDNNPAEFTEERVEFEFAWDKMYYSAPEIERIAHVAFKQAMQRDKKVCSVDKANVLDVSRLWRKTVAKVAKEYPEVELSNMYVDNCAMQLINNPKQFDVILTGNMFGDILSDEASMLTGSIGLLPSASVNGEGVGVYEPIHGSAPDIAGTGKANPIATIDSAAMLLRDLGEIKAADCIVDAIKEALKTGYRTRDIANAETKEAAIVNCLGMGDIISRIIKEY